MATIEVKNSKVNEIDKDDVVEAYISGLEDYVIPLILHNYLIRLEGEKWGIRKRIFWYRSSSIFRICSCY